MDPRSINFNVLRRHDSKITSIIDSTSYVVIYRYFHGAWSKTGLEGTMFIFERDGEVHQPRYGVFVLNRQGLDNMSQGLLPGWEVDLDEGLIIWRNEGATGDADDDIIHGLWIYEEQDRSRIAGVMQSLIDLSTPQSEPEPTTSSPQVSLSHPVPRVPIIPAGQSISLDQLFGVGSVCSEPPPPTSDLPHPASSVADSSEPQNALPPQHVMSPDPSDLPKGMQLLDSLFQKASLKTQTSNPSISSADSIAQQSMGIHQVLQTQPMSPHPIQNHPSSGSSTLHHHHLHHHHRRNSSDENYKPQAYNEVNRNPNHKAHHHQRAPNSKSGSRHSSGGSSSHPRSEKMVGPSSNGQTGPSHYPVQSNPQYQSTQAGLVSASQTSNNESAHAEARHNILSLLGHPIATSAPHHHNLPGQISNSGTWTGANGGSPDSIRSGGGNRDVYQPSSYGRNHQAKYTSHHHHHHPHPQEGNPNHRSQQNSQHSSPQQTHSPHSNAYSNASQLVQTSSQVPSLQPELGSPHHSSAHAHAHHHHLSRNGTQFHQPPPQQAGPTQVKVRGTPPKPPLPNVPVQNRQSQVSAPNHVWNENYPKRAMSPLNPASQTQSQTQRSSQQVGPQWNGQSNRTSNVGDFPAPVVNDSSRPSRSHGLHPQSLAHSQGKEGTVFVNKVVAEVLDEGLAGREYLEVNGKNKNGRRKNGKHQHGQNGDRDGDRDGDGQDGDGQDGEGEEGDEDEENREDEALDKKEFVGGVLELIKTNGAFVDMLYARYLARYAERYL
ncbi:uncharacterized protein MELLADRAFT_94936 [Melampsora larici-populina 98AG31]|uniref:mRNA-decapping enzyme C-terminal domain-containing protein n=1 Tax=Melampsora larici-populina (strain 98AG31 / pathotype 3-4-7) TaxID=747676 RepID=F4S8K2_MELLP|nr:uncharacterized protein MELLADRAFT_94936 [Melampsora larici-populina 98AG31]EGF99056.1 hypothetical protein MELLADRAFT_94936 [Melampsora larici-populina 98AG31]